MNLSPWSHLSILPRNPCPIFSVTNPKSLSSFISYESVETKFARKLQRARKRRRLFPQAVFSVFPLLPFESHEVLVPSESKTLHLYEARYLAMLEESLDRKKFFVHFVLDPVVITGSSAGASFSARYGCLVFVENVERLEIGALVSIRGICRVSIMKFLQMEPYLRGAVLPMQDNSPEIAAQINFAVTGLREAIYNLHSLQLKLKASKDELLQTRLTNSLRWAEKESFVDCDKAFIPALAERISFAALQPVSGSMDSELLALNREKLRAMDLKDTSERDGVVWRMDPWEAALLFRNWIINSD